MLVKSQLWIKGELLEPYLSMLNYWLMKGSEGGEVIIFNLIPIRLQQIEPKLRSHGQPWFHSQWVTKQNTKTGIGKRNLWGGSVGTDRDQRE